MEDKDSILSDFENREEEASPVQKIVETVIDWGVEIILIVIIYNLFFHLVDSPKLLSSLPNTIFLLLVIIGYRFLTIMSLGRTLGMMALKLKYLNSNLKPLTRKERFLAVFGMGLIDVKIYKQR
jgi:uncharacterized RDD family membrane protein YckC